LNEGRSTGIFVRVSRSQLNPRRRIHLQKSNGRPASGRQTDDMRAPQDEMIFPRLPSRMKERNDRTGLMINPREVRALVQVAIVASQGKVRLDRWAAMLTGHDVLDVK
jgi:hypothetical protein